MSGVPPIISHKYLKPESWKDPQAEFKRLQLSPRMMARNGAQEEAPTNQFESFPNSDVLPPLHRQPTPQRSEDKSRNIFSMYETKSWDERVKI
jgi:hypothetical protein